MRDTMQEFMRKFTQLNGMGTRVILEHCLFDRQALDCDELQMINDDERVGLILKSHQIFMYKQNVKVAEVHDNIYMISDGRLTITIIMNKL